MAGDKGKEGRRREMKQCSVTAIRPPEAIPVHFLAALCNGAAELPFLGFSRISGLSFNCYMLLYSQGNQKYSRRKTNIFAWYDEYNVTWDPMNNISFCLESHAARTRRGVMRTFRGALTPHAASACPHGRVLLR
jgi:hypothetical protein